MLGQFLSEVHNLIHCFRVIFNSNSEGINGMAYWNQILQLLKVTLTYEFFWLHNSCWIHYCGCQVTYPMITMQILLDLESTNTTVYAYVHMQTILCTQNASSQARMKSVFDFNYILFCFIFALWKRIFICFNFINS